MSVTVLTKDVGDVKEKFIGEFGYSLELDKGNEDYIKKEFKLK